jgi:hypothetical protein
MNNNTKRRQRRQANAVWRNGKTAIRKHTKVAGRTGGIQSKRTPSSKLFERHTAKPNPQGPTVFNVGTPDATQ